MAIQPATLALMQTQVLLQPIVFARYLINGGPTPVTFININAAANGINIAVQCKAGRRQNMTGYQIEKSTDGRSFTKLRSKAATAGSTETLYNWLDIAAIKSH